MSNKKLYSDFLEEQVKIIPSLNDILNLKGLNTLMIEWKILILSIKKKLE